MWDKRGEKGGIKEKGREDQRKGKSREQRKRRDRKEGKKDQRE